VGVGTRNHRILARGIGGVHAPRLFEFGSDPDDIAMFTKMRDELGNAVYKGGVGHGQFGVGRDEVVL
jgi:hypothetical protein